MYKLIISPHTQKELKVIKQIYQQPMKLALDEIRDDPEIGKPLTKELNNRFSYRVGVYRIIYRVNKKDKVIHILSAGHRATIYR